MLDFDISAIKYLAGFSSRLVLHLFPFSRRAACNWRRFGQAGAIALIAVVPFLLTSEVSGQSLDPATQWATDASYKLQLHTNIVYQRAGSVDLKLDVITAGENSPRPVLIYFHGGGWVAGNKDGLMLTVLPYVARGMDAVTVDYRLASQALAPAAVEDGRCALHWVVRHAKEYGFDTNKIVIAGESAGGHLALMIGMLTPAAGFDDTCEVPMDSWQTTGPKDVKVAAIVNFFGPTDLQVFLEPSTSDTSALPMPRYMAMRWLGDQPNRIELAKRLSPLTYVRKDLPPILTVHGDKDPIVPYKQALILRDALEHVGAQNQLTTIERGGHGGTPPFAWTLQQSQTAHQAVFQFLEKLGIFSESK